MVCVKLDATPLGQPLYERFGFKPERTLTRWEIQAAPSLPRLSTEEFPPFEEADWAQVLELDRQAFGVRRPRLLHALRAQCATAVVCRGREGTGFGYGMLRKGSRAWYLGPAAATSPEAGSDIIRQLVGTITGQPVFWDVLDLNRPAARLAETLGFKPQRHLVRMVRGSPGQVENPAQEFAIVDPATG
jgi:hypothetical protein